MSGALALSGAQAYFQTLQGINNAYQEQAYAELSSGMMQQQMDEINARTNEQIAGINQQAEKVVAGQTAAFIQGGVDLSGSAMSVISDTLNDAAQAAYIRRRETDYNLENMAVEKFQMDKAASNETFMLKVATSAIGGASTFGKAMYDQNKVNTRSRGAAGIGGGTDAFGGTTSYSGDYMNS